jgi:hypothetical protein
MKIAGSLNVIAEELLKAVEDNQVTCGELLALEAGPYYAQLLFNRDVIFGEVVSNTYLTGSELLTTAQEGYLLDLGWMAPNARCHSSCERSHPNFHRTWSQGAPSERIVRDLVAAIVSVFMRGEGELLAFIRELRLRLPSHGLPCNH